VDFHRFAVLAAGAFLGCAAGAASAAAPQRAFVASGGNDANPCSLALPCRSLATAIAAVAASGEVVVLDSAGYGSVTIAKSVTIGVPGGVHAGITAFSGAGVTVDGVGIAVALRGLTIVALGGVTGIAVTNAASVQIDDCRISGFPAAGIALNANARVAVTDTIVGSSGSAGISITDGNVSLERVQVREATGTGIVVSRGTVHVRDSLIEDVGGDGLFASVVSPNAARVTIEGTTITRLGPSGRGIVAEDASGFGFSASVVVRARGNDVTDGGGSGIVSQGTHASMIASRNLVSGMNGYGFLQQVIGVGPSASFVSSKDNVLDGNVAGPTSGNIVAGSLY
jgi:hypothetical protein